MQTEPYTTNQLEKPPLETTTLEARVADFFALSKAEQLDAAASCPALWALYCSQGQWHPYAHLLQLDEILYKVAQGEIDRVLVTMPPQHGKSEFTTHYFPSWFIGSFPKKRVIVASYESDHAAEFGGKARDTLEEYGPEVFGVTIDQRSSARSRWRVAGKPGAMRTAGAAGPITGKPADLFIIDDPFKGPKDAQSPERQAEVLEWYKAVVLTRLAKGGAVIIIQTRWDENDLAGRLLRIAMEEANDQDIPDDEREDWVKIDFPAIAEKIPEGETDQLGRVNGDALCPPLHDELELRRTKRAVGPYWWAALYQQRPMPLQGGILQRPWVRRWRTRTLHGQVYYELDRRHEDGTPLEPEIVAPSACTRFITVDLAASRKKGSSYTVAGTWALTPKADLILLDVWRQRAEGPEQFTVIEDLHKRMRPSFIGVESVGYQLTAVQTLVRRGLPITELRPDRSKKARALLLGARMSAGTVFTPEERHWLGEYEEELFRYKGGDNEVTDQIDMSSYAALVAARDEYADESFPIAVAGGSGDYYGRAG